MATSSIANSRAVSTSESPRASATCAAMPFQCPGGVAVPAPSAQKRAISVCSGVRTELFAFPRACTAATSATYSGEPVDGGGGGRKAAAAGMPKGVTAPQPGRSGGAKPEGVGRQWPGSEDQM